MLSWAALTLASSLFAAEALLPQVREQGLAILATNEALGLSAEARALRARLDAGGALEPLSPAMRAALRHMNSYFAMTEETLKKPIQFEELRQALTSPTGVETARKIFEKVISLGVKVNGRLESAEIGGEATLDGGNALFHEIDDPTRPIYRKLAASREDAKALIALRAEDPEAFDLLDEHGQLGRALDRWPEWEKKLTADKRQAILKLVVDAALESASNTYLREPKAQLKAIIADPWAGRYIGPWHTHPPQDDGRAFTVPDESHPSCADIELAAKSGQNLVLRFQADGFDVFDLSPFAGGDGACNIDLARSFSHRSEAWRLHFQHLHR